MDNLLQKTLRAVQSLNKPEQPFLYRVDGNTIIGEWKYLDAEWVAPLAAGHVDQSFKIVVTLDEASHTYTSKDNETKNFSKISIGIGGIDARKESDFFSGKMKKIEFGGGLGKANQPQNKSKVSEHLYKYNFKTSEIKQPLFDFLEQQGWKKPKKGGFLSRLFDH